MIGREPARRLVIGTEAAHRLAISTESARRVANIVSVQNRYNLTDRSSEPVLSECERDGIAFLPWSPLSAGSDTAGVGRAIRAVAARHGATPPQVAIANEAEDSQVDHQDIQAGAMSKQTRAERRGLNWPQEKARIAREAQEGQPQQRGDQQDQRRAVLHGPWKPAAVSTVSSGGVSTNWTNAAAMLGLGAFASTAIG